MQRRSDPKLLICAERESKQFPVSITNALRESDSFQQRRLRHRQPDCARKSDQRDARSQNASAVFRGARPSRALVSASRRNRLEREKFVKARRFPRPRRARSPEFQTGAHSMTVIAPPTPDALILRSYIDSANTGGTTNFPRLHDLIV